MESTLKKEFGLPFEPYEFNEVCFTIYNDAKNHYFDSLQKQFNSDYFKDMSNDKKIEKINEYFSVISITEGSEVVRKFLIEHIDKVKNLQDFSWICFGIELDEEDESYWFRNHAYGSYKEGELSEREIFVGISYNEFHAMDTISKLNWMLEKLEFIPIRIHGEHISSLYGQEKSYKFSHIKRDCFIMDELKPYLDGLQYQPNPNSYYFIMYDKKDYHRVYLLKDKTRQH